MLSRFFAQSSRTIHANCPPCGTRSANAPQEAVTLPVPAGTLPAPATLCAEVSPAKGAVTAPKARPKRRTPPTGWSDADRRKKRSIARARPARDAGSKGPAFSSGGSGSRCAEVPPKGSADCITAPSQRKRDRGRLSECVWVRCLVCSGEAVWACARPGVNTEC